MKISIIVFILFAAIPTSYLQGQCNPDPATITEGGRLTPPQGFASSVAVFDRASNVESPLTLTGGQVIVDLLVFAAADTAKTMAKDPKTVVLRWKNTSGAFCDQAFGMGAGGSDVTNASTSTAEPTGAEIYSFCEKEGAAEAERLRASRRLTAGDRDDFTLVVMHPRVGLCYASRDFGVQGEPIIVALASTTTYAFPTVRLTPCSPRPSGPRVHVVEGGLKAPGAQRSALDLQVVRSSACYDPTVSITVTSTVASSTGPTEVSTSHSVSQYTRYHATLQVGAVFTDNQQRSFGLRPIADGKFAITDEGPVDEGPEYYAALMVYALPRYFRGFFSGQRYDGRELTTERSFQDRLSLVIGSSLRNPGNRLGAGLSYEILPGINVLGIYERALISHLNGVAVGDAFAGTKEQIPLKKSWDEQVVFGIGIDGRYALGIFTGK